MPQKPKKTTSRALSKDSIKNAAFLLSTEQKSYDEWVWLAAETDLKVKKGMKPNDVEIRMAAEELGKKGLSFQDLHWMIAEKRLINRVNAPDKKKEIKLG